MLDRRINHFAQFGVGFHRILYVVDHLIKLGVIDQLFAEMGEQDRFQEDVKRLAAALGIVARNILDSLPD